MVPGRLRYTLRLAPTRDGQLRIALESGDGRRRYFASLEALTAFLRRELAEQRREPGR